MDNHGKLILEEATHQCIMLLRLLKMIPFLAVQMIQVIRTTISIHEGKTHHFSLLKYENTYLSLMHLCRLCMVAVWHTTSICWVSNCLWGGCYQRPTYVCAATIVQSLAVGYWSLKPMRLSVQRSFSLQFAHGPSALRKSADISQMHWTHYALLASCLIASEVTVTTVWHWAGEQQLLMATAYLSLEVWAAAME